MYLRTTERKNKDGSVIKYYQLAHNVRHPDSKLGVWDRWLKKVYMPSCKKLGLDHMYDAMDYLFIMEESLKLSGRISTYSLLDDAELLLTIYAANPPELELLEKESKL